MKFWKDNRIDREHEVHASEILDAYLSSEQFKNWQQGANFDRGLAIFLTDTYGSYDQKDFKKLGDYIFKAWENRLKTKAVLSHLGVKA